MNGTNNNGVDLDLGGGQTFHLDLEPAPGAVATGDGGAGGDAGAGGASTGGEGGAGTGAGGGPQIPDNVAKMISDNVARATKAEQERDLLQRQMDDLKKSQGQPFMPGAPQPTPQDIRNNLAKQLEERALKEGFGNVLADVLLASTQLSQQTAERAMTGVANGQADLLINSYITAKESDPAFAMVRDSFMQKVAEARAATPPEQLARATPQQIQQSLDALYKQSAGELALSSFAQRSRANPPPGYAMAGGSGAGGNMRAFNAQQGAGDMTPQNAVEKEIIESGKSYGLSDDQIKAALKAHREDNG